MTTRAEPNDHADDDGETAARGVNLLVGPMLRHVTATTATVFVETDAPCTVEICSTRTRTFTVAGHHYALVVIEDLPPASTLPYDVRLDGDVRWPRPDSALPPSVIGELLICVKHRESVRVRRSTPSR